MSMTFSPPLAPPQWRALALRRGWIALCLAAALGVGVVAIFSPQTQRVSAEVRSMEWRPAIAGEASPSEGEWRGFEVGAGTDGHPIWLRTRFELSDAEARAGTAEVLLSGVFSARAWLNGAPIGDKGVPGFTRQTETPGPIDEVLPLGAAAHAGSNEIILLMSAQHTYTRSRGLLHELAILPEGGDARRPLGRYCVALSQAGVLLLIAVGFLSLALRNPNRLVHAWAATGAAFLLLAMAAETARTWWSYPYPLQALRLGLVWFGMSGFAFALTQAAMGLGGRTRLSESVLAMIALASALLFINDFDERTRLTLIAAMFTTFSIVARRAWLGDNTARLLAGLCGVTLVLLFVRGPEVIDNWIYVCGAALLGMFAWPASAIAETECSTLDLEGEALACADVVLVKAAGNYAEVHMQDRRVLLVRKALTDLAPRSQLMRVHRSYIVNLEHARRLVAKTGSRYELELAQGSIIPVSRRRADAVRTALKGRCAPQPKR